ncbi:MAG TPA: hypothetical protein VJH89_03590 [Patescibacteria group bacterium]|nr:hypothetical protein [Patescibacteria group bacterium]
MKIVLGQIVIEDGEVSVRIPLVEQLSDKAQIAVAEAIQQWCAENEIPIYQLVIYEDAIHLILTETKLLPFAMAPITHCLAGVNTVLQTTVQPQSTPMTVH